ncbi:hypothetical protein L1077_26765 [Pseudoalteromonas luteoviolacea]|uniref:hypothetical protein n=1 Tax=Pseudoalteromonas luteoviolacea TaxID=43657 RepID=UPI001F394EB9|nr:hypothetical protein [Pseudoalteromonas luteoviolacea]MCF6443032.1 hypothetical protein [Pseudoalteromonas luteoviolacea]
MVPNLDDGEPVQKSCVGESEKHKQTVTDDSDKYNDSLETWGDNITKYQTTGVYYEELSKQYLHHQSHEERLAKAAELNGCDFKKSNLKNEEFVSREHTDIDHHVGLCDGQVAAIRRAPGIWLVCIFLNVILFAVGFGGLLIGLLSGPLWLIAFSPLMVASPWGLYKFWEKFDWLDKLEFNRHTGLVRTSHTLLRRPFYIPIEDIELCQGPVVKNARGGGEMPTGSLVFTQYPSKFWWRPSIVLLGGMEKEHWTALNKFMDISQPIHMDVQRSIEEHFQKDKNAMGTGPFPESMKKYLDAEDKQINRFEVW